MKLIVTFEQMEAEKNRLNRFLNPRYDEWRLNWQKCYFAEKAAMEQLEEAVFALAAERTRRNASCSRDTKIFTEHIGLYAQYEPLQNGFEIEAWRLFPELIAVFDDLQKLGSFKIRFEKDNGEAVADDWWRDETLELYNPTASEANGYDFEALLEAVEQGKAKAS